MVEDSTLILGLFNLNSPQFTIFLRFTTMTTVFIYQPTTGDRVFASRPNQFVRVVEWQNGCRHVTGGVHFSWQTATAGRHWRGPAVAMATAIVAAVGGVAWDENGVVHLVVPHTSAYLAWDWMCDTATAAIGDDAAPPDSHDKSNIVRLIVEGVASFASGQLDGTPEQCTDVVDIPVNCALPTYCPLICHSDGKVPEGFFYAKGDPWIPVTVFCGGVPVST
jgi:hypothetical protein